MKWHDGLAGLGSDYDGYILDLWGVVHNGVAPIRACWTVLDTCARRASGSCCYLMRPGAPQRWRRACAAWLSVLTCMMAS